MLKNQQGLKCSSSYVGVCWDKMYQRWKVLLYISKKRFRLGKFKHEKNAGWVYNQVAKRFKPPNHWNNTIPDDFELPNETENRDQVITSKINRIQNYLDSLT